MQVALRPHVVIPTYAVVACVLHTTAVPAQENLGFESLQENGGAAAWSRSGGSRHEVRIDDGTAFEGSRSLRISFTEPDPNNPYSFGGTSQTLPAAGLAGNWVRLNGYVRTENVDEGYAGLWMRVDRVDGTWFLANVQESPIQGTTDWETYDVDVPLTDDAVRLSFGAVLTGRGSAWFDDFSVEVLDTSTWPSPTDDVRAYIDEALDIMRERSVRKQSIDWDALKASMTDWARGATTTREAYFAIRVALSELKDGHSVFYTPEQASALRANSGNAGAFVEPPAPRGAVLEDVIGYISVPSFLSVNEARMTQFADELKNIIAKLDSPQLCGWIVDLRDDGGGNVFPMIAGIGSILGEGNAGGGMRADGERLHDWYRDGAAGIGERAQVRVSGEPYVLATPNPPVAVLIGPRTASSGEQMALAFIGRPQTRTFGLPTAGLTTGNAPFSLSDGAVLNLTVSTMFDRAGRGLAENRIERKRGRPFANPSLLVGLLYDDAGLRMTPTHANKKGTRYRYYISQKLTTTARQDNPLGRRVPARDIERLVEDCLTRFLADKAGLFDVLESVVVDAAERMRYIDAADELAERWGRLEPAVKRTWLVQLIHRIDLGVETLSVSICPGHLATKLDEAGDPSKLSTQDTKLPAPDKESQQVVTLTIPARLKRAGMEMRLLIDGAGSGARNKSDRSLCRLLAQAYRFQSLLLNSRGRTMAEVAAEAGVTYPYFRRVLTVGFLAPDIAQAILRDRHPIELNAQQLSKNTILPLSWDEQRSLLGLD